MCQIIKEQVNYQAQAVQKRLFTIIKEFPVNPCWFLLGKTGEI